MAIIGAIETSKTDIHSIGLGCVMSSALDVFVACHHRSAHRMTTFMYHSLRSISEGEVEKQVTDITESLRIQREGDKFLLSRTKLPKKRLEEIKKKKDDWYFTAQEALKYGVIDEII
jgi:ATP-dependent Clp protease protease subunit